MSFKVIVSLYVHKRCSLHNLSFIPNIRRYFDYIWLAYIFGEDGVSHARKVALPGFLFELSFLNEL